MDAGTWFVFRGSELLVRVEEGSARLLGGAEWSILALPTSGEPHRIGEMEGLSSYAVGLAAAAEPPEGWSFLGLRALWGLMDEPTWHLAGRAVQIVDWDRNHRFCGRGRTPTEVEAAELARRCPACGLQQFPRISPAVIVLVRRGDRMLLARSPHFAPGVYSTLAGFVEPGESLEQAVAREVMEEVGVTLTNIRYFGSQPWPFPNSLMLGFTADYAGGDIRPQPGEIEDAGWFGADHLPGLPSPMSIARRLVEAFLAEPRAQ
jgi:NAD+ diphosphatase